MGTDDGLITELWHRRALWSHAADRMKRRVDRARTAVMLSSSLGAIAATTTATILRSASVAQSVVATAGALCLAVATFLTAQYLTPEAHRRWSRARAVSEGIKASFYKFRAGVRPYVGERAVQMLQREIDRIEHSALDLVPELATAPVEGSPMPSSLTPEEYVRQRVEHQITDYYQAKGREYAARSRRLRRVALILSLATTTVAAIAPILAGRNASTPLADSAPAIAAWVAVLTTLSGAIAVHIAGNRYDYLVLSYSATSIRLQRLVSAWQAEGSPTDEPKWTEFVGDCETAISVENESWMAKWNE